MHFRGHRAGRSHGGRSRGRRPVRTAATVPAAAAAAAAVRGRQRLLFLRGRIVERGGRRR